MLRKSAFTALLAVLVGAVMAGCSNEESGPSASSGEKTKYDALYKEVSEAAGRGSAQVLRVAAVEGREGHGRHRLLRRSPDLGGQPADLRPVQGRGLRALPRRLPAGQRPMPTSSGSRAAGTEINGPFSKQSLKLPFTDYVPLPEGPVGDPDKTYKIGVTFHGFDHPWLINWADAAQWEADAAPERRGHGARRRVRQQQDGVPLRHLHLPEGGRHPRVADGRGADRAAGAARDGGGHSRS